MEMLASEYGVPSFKIFMFYGGYGLHGKAGTDAQRQFLMLDEGDSYDLAHFEFIMRSASRLMKLIDGSHYGVRVSDLILPDHRQRV